MEGNYVMRTLEQEKTDCQNALEDLRDAASEAIANNLVDENIGLVQDYINSLEYIVSKETKNG